jgi:hypothetical protein
MVAPRTSGTGTRSAARARETTTPREQTRSDYHMTPTWPEIRVIRQPDIESQLNDDWNYPLNKIGEQNYGKGKVHGLGSLAVTYIPAKAMGRMLEAKYSDAYRTPERTRNVQRKVADSIRDYVRERHGTAYRASTYAQQDMAEADPMILRTAKAGRPVGLMPQDARVQQSESQLLFGDASLVVSGIKIFGKDGFGLDLTTNDQLYAERAGLLKYLQRYEGLDTQPLQTDGWEAHATIFTFEDHIRAKPLQVPVPVPPSIAFEAPRPV